MRCDRCLQIIHPESMRITIHEDPQGTLHIGCKCGWSEAYLISRIWKQKSPFCKIVSVYEKGGNQDGNQASTKD